MEKVSDPSRRRLKDRIVTQARGKSRWIIAIAGAPGAGKSTLARELALLFERKTAKVVEMDGYHYDNGVLDELGLRARKGSPETFDYQGLATLMERLRRVEPQTAIPLFDRAADLARAGADIIRPETKFIIVEGNYLLLDEAPWSNLAAYFDMRIFLDVPIEVLRARLIQRWLDLGCSEQESRNWVESNDIPNVQRVLAKRQPADLIV